MYYSKFTFIETPKQSDGGSSDLALSGPDSEDISLTTSIESESKGSESEPEPEQIPSTRIESEPKDMGSDLRTSVEPEAREAQAGLNFLGSESDHPLTTK